MVSETINKVLKKENEVDLRFSKAAETAEKKAQDILTDARKRADSIIDQAKQLADEILSKADAESDVRLDEAKKKAEKTAAGLRQKNADLKEKAVSLISDILFSDERG